VAYHCDKYERGFQDLIDVWGPDHHGRIIATRAGVEALGYADRGFEIILHQTVRLLKGGQPVRMSKRRGEIVSLREILDAVGRDVARFFFLMRSTESHLDFDLDLAMQQSNENPVFYVQYAHTRMCGIFRQAAEQGVALDAEHADLSLLTHERETDLIRHLADFPGEVLAAAEARAPHRLTQFARELARQFTLFYEACKVLGEAPELTQARLALVRAAQIVLANTLRLLGLSAPARM
jgi:arginyl-tRNA synthetase